MVCSIVPLDRGDTKREERAMKDKIADKLMTLVANIIAGVIMIAVCAVIYGPFIYIASQGSSSGDYSEPNYRGRR